MAYNINVSGIKSWAEDDRPREKMILKGKAALSDAELLAILISNGSKEHTALDLGKIILNSVGNDLHKLARLSIKDLQKIKGIGVAKAVTIAAALELGRRKKDSEKVERIFIDNSRTAYEALRVHLSDLRHEEFWVICLSRRLEILKLLQVSSGGIAGTIVDLKILFSMVLENLGSAIIIAHNHPSGSLHPSKEDIVLTKKIKEAANVLDITLADHIIFTDQGYYSFADENML